MKVHSYVIIDSANVGGGNSIKRALLWPVRSSFLSVALVIVQMLIVENKMSDIN